MAYMKTSEILSKVCTPEEILSIKSNIENETGKNVTRLRRIRNNEEYPCLEVKLDNDASWKKVKIPHKRRRQEKEDY